MFIRQKVFEKLLKEAYKGSGIYVSKTNSDTNEPVYVIATSWWVLWVGTEWLTKEAKAAVIKLCGDLPAMGYAYRAAKDYDNQYEIENKYDDALAGYLQAKEEVRRTKLSARNDMDILQGSSGKIYIIDKKMMELVDYGSIERGQGEVEPSGPYLGHSGTVLYWRNNACTLMICLIEIPKSEKEFWKYLGQTSVI